MPCTKLSHGHSVFGILAQPPPLALRWRMCSPLTASVSSTRTHHLPASPYATVSHGTPETEPQKLGFKVFGPNHITRPRMIAPHHSFIETEPRRLGFWVLAPLPPDLALANALSPSCLHVIYLHPQPLCIIPCCRKPRDGCSFSVFSPNPPALWVGECRAPLPPSHSPTATTTPFCAAVSHSTPKIEHLLGFRFLSFLIIF